MINECTNHPSQSSQSYWLMYKLTPVYPPTTLTKIIGKILSKFVIFSREEKSEFLRKLPILRIPFSGFLSVHDFLYKLGPTYYTNQNNHAGLSCVTTKLYNYYLENCDVSKRIATGGVLFILKLSKMFIF